MHYGESAELIPGKPLRPDVEGDLFDIRLQLDPGEVHVVGVQIRGNDLRYDAVAQRLSFLGKEVEIEVRDGSISLHLLVDRTSLEVFAHDGEVSMSFCFLPEAADVPLVFYAEGGVAQLRALELHELRSAWV